jgi:N-acetylneuraminate lyase
MDPELKGILPAIASPCDENDTFLEDKFAELVIHLYRAGSHGLYVCGGTGDGYNMRLNERKRAAEIAVELSREFSGTVIVHVGSGNTRDAAELARHAADVGADAISSMPPMKRNQRQMKSYYTDVARAAEIPLVIYHNPGYSGFTPTVDQLVELLDIDGVVGFKFSDYNFCFMKLVMLKRPDKVVLNGFDECLCPGLLYGAHGGIGLNYNLFPKLFLGIYQSVVDGNAGRAMELQDRLQPFMDVLLRYGLYEAFECMIRELGLAPYIWRRPRISLDEQTTRKLMAEAQPLIDGMQEGL